MQEIKYPYFKKDRILKIEMLENLRDFPRDMVEAYFSNLSDGILCGFSPSAEKGQLWFSKGAVKHQGSVYITQSPIMVSYGDTEERVMIKLCFEENLEGQDFRSVGVTVKLSSAITLLENQMELGRFQLKKGAFLRSKYTDLFDFATLYNTIDMVDTMYAGIEKGTIYPVIVKFFAMEALKAKTQNAVDLSFCFNCLNSQRTERDAINHYLAYRLDEPFKEYSNREIHDRLVKILNDIRRDGSVKKRKMMYNTKIIVD